jgi:hypothetical protein
MRAFGADQVPRRDYLPVMLLLAAVIASSLAVFLSVPGSTVRRWSFGPFAGYQWDGHVRSLQASWTVPLIDAGSPKRSCAGTWIGAAAPGNNGPFIQIGTNEQLVTPRQARDWGVPRHYYFAFWSDTRMHFLARSLFLVRPGDEISASLSLTSRRWRLAIRDTTNGKTARFSTRQEAGGAFNEAQWLQEDVTDSKTNKLFPYPRLSAVAFRRLAVNARRPSYADLYTNWMSEDGVNWAPTPLRYDSFALAQATVSKAGAQYIRIMNLEDGPTNKFFGLAGAWNARTPQKRIQAEVAKYGAVLRTGSRMLNDSAWPSPARQIISSLAANQRWQISSLRAVAAGPPARSSAALNNAFPTYNGPDTYGHEICRALHLPEVAAQC